MDERTEDLVICPNPMVDDSALAGRDRMSSEECLTTGGQFIVDLVKPPSFRAGIEEVASVGGTGFS